MNLKVDLKIYKKQQNFMILKYDFKLWSSKLAKPLSS